MTRVKGPSKIAADDILIFFFFYYFLQKVRQHFVWMLHMKCLDLFTLKNMKKKKNQSAAVVIVSLRVKNAIAASAHSLTLSIQIGFS